MKFEYPSEDEKKAFLARYPFERLWKEIGGERRISIFPRIRRWLIASRGLQATVALAGIASLMIFGLWHIPEFTDIRSKGGVGLTFYTAPVPGAEIVRGKDGMTLPAGADLQFVTSNPNDPFLLLIGVEENGALSVYSPEGAIRWQPTSSYERFYALFSKEPIPLEKVKQALAQVSQGGKTVEQTSKLPLPYPQATILVRRKPGK